MPYQARRLGDGEEVQYYQSRGVQDDRDVG
jgi:hypothetical protein